MPILEHPDISCALRTGYPLRHTFPCQCCGGAAAWFDEMGNGYCRKCAVQIADDSRQSKILEMRDRIDELISMREDALLDWAGLEECV